MENKKNTILLTVIAVATLLVAVVGATFAYFSASTGSTATKNVTVQTGSAGSSAITIDNAIAITADQTTFAKGQPSRTGVANGTITFTAPGATGDSTPAAKDLQFCFNASVTVTANDFEYTQTGNTKEITLDVEVGGTKVIDAYDITTFTGTINIPTSSSVIDYTKTYEHKITAAAGGTQTQTVKTTVTLVNLDADQNDNMGKSLSGTLKITQVDCAA